MAVKFRAAGVGGDRERAGADGCAVGGGIAFPPPRRKDAKASRARYRAGLFVQYGNYGIHHLQSDTQITEF